MTISVSLLIAGLISVSCSKQPLTLKSPNGDLAMDMEVHNLANSENTARTFRLYNADSNDDIIKEIRLGIETGKQDFNHNLKLIGASEPVPVIEDYEMLSGKKSKIHSEAYEQVFTLENEAGNRLNIRCRAFDDGFAFRYEIPEVADNDYMLREHTSYIIPDGQKRWIQQYHPSSYEWFYTPETTGAPEENAPRPYQYAYPVLTETGNGKFALISESNIARGHSVSYLDNSDDLTRYKVMQGSDSVKIAGQYISPWRVVIAGDLPTLTQSTLITDLAEPSKIEDTAWINPAPASWPYWAYNHGSKDYMIVSEYIDLAANMGWPYTLIDVEWDEMTNGGNIDDALAYARQKGVKPMLWYNSSTGWLGNGAPHPLFRLNTPENRHKEFQWLKEKGVAGIKVDFFPGDDVATTDYMIDLMEDAAEYNLLVTLHGATVPRGWQRTYPNLMTVEGVYGAEWYNNNSRLTAAAAAHNATLPFTRNIIGPMDYTPGTFSDSQHPHITTFAHELALPVLFESAIQHMPDTPQSYQNLPPKANNLLKFLPTTWDETRLLDGYPGDFAIVARRKHDRWYIAGINGRDEKRSLTIDFAKLKLNGRPSLLFFDGSDPQSISVLDFVTDYTQEVECLPRGGFVVVINPDD